MRRRAVLAAAALGTVALAGAGWGLRTAGLIGGMSAPPPLEMLCRDAAGCRATFLVRLASAPFPVGPDPGGAAPNTPRAYSGAAPGVASAYRDDRVLVHVPPGFDPARPFHTLLFFHGHRARIEATLADEYALFDQVNGSGRNLILVAPQLARGAVDSDPGKLARPGAARRLVADALGKTAEILGVPAPLLQDGKIVVAAFSGGWWPAAETLSRGGLDGRVTAVILLDAHYGGAATFAAWAEANRTAALVSLYTRSSAPGAEALLGRLIAANIEAERDLPDRIGPGTVVLARRDTPHPRLVTDGPPRHPLAGILRRLPAFEDTVPDPAALGDTRERPDDRR